MLSILAIIAGITTTIYANIIIDKIGEIDAFEKPFGVGNSALVIKVLGIIVAIVSFMYLVGALDGVESGVQKGLGQ